MTYEESLKYVAITHLGRRDWGTIIHLKISKCAMSFCPKNANCRASSRNNKKLQVNKIRILPTAP